MRMLHGRCETRAGWISNRNSCVHLTLQTDYCCSVFLGMRIRVLRTGRLYPETDLQDDIAHAEISTGKPVDYTVHTVRLSVTYVHMKAKYLAMESCRVELGSP